MNYGNHGVMKSQTKTNRTKFRFFTTTSGDWISKEDLINYIDSHLSKTIFFEDQIANRKLINLKQELQKCYYKED